MYTMVGDEVKIHVCASYLDRYQKNSSGATEVNVSLLSFPSDDGFGGKSSSQQFLACSKKGFSNPHSKEEGTTCKSQLKSAIAKKEIIQGVSYLQNTSKVSGSICYFFYM